MKKFRINILLFLKYRLNKIIIYYAIEGGGRWPIIILIGFEGRDEVIQG